MNKQMNVDVQLSQTPEILKRDKRFAAKYCRCVLSNDQYLRSRLCGGLKLCQLAFHLMDEGDQLTGAPEEALYRRTRSRTTETGAVLGFG